MATWPLLTAFVLGRFLFLVILVLRLKYSERTRSIPWLLMPWLLASPGHQHPRYWLSRTNKSLSSMKKDFIFNQLPRENGRQCKSKFCVFSEISTGQGLRLRYALNHGKYSQVRFGMAEPHLSLGVIILIWVYQNRSWCCTSSCSLLKVGAKFL